MLEALAAWPLAVYLREDFYAYPLVNAAHILALGILVTSALLMDFRLLGLGRRIPLDAVITGLRPVAMGALLATLVTGFLLFSVQPLDYVANPAFLIKMGLLTVVVLNAAAFTLLGAHRWPQRPWTKVLALLSALLWTCVLIAGRFIGFVVG